MNLARREQCTAGPQIDRRDGAVFDRWPPPRGVRLAHRMRLRTPLALVAFLGAAR